MVYVDPKNLGYNCYWQRWLQSRCEEEQEILQELYEKLIPAAIDYILEGVDGTQQEDPLKFVVPQTNLNMIRQLCHFYDALFPPNKSLDLETVECGFIQSIYSSLGAALLETSKIRFDRFLKKLLGMINYEDSFEKPAKIGQLPTTKSTLYDYIFDMEQKVWMAWDWLVPGYVHNSEINFSEILVPTVDTLKTDWILTLMNNVRF